MFFDFSEPNQFLQYEHNLLQHGPSAAGNFYPNQQNVEEEEDDVSSGSSITGFSSDWASSDYDSSGSDNEVEQLEGVDVSLDDAFQEAMTLSHGGEKCVRYYKQLNNAFKSKKPTMGQWILSWPKESAPAWLNVYGYYDKDKGCGGYGVILRNLYVRPIIAATYFTQGKQGDQSQLIQALKGLKTGLELAVKYGYCRRLKVLCNVEKAIFCIRGLSTFQHAGACIVSAENHEVIHGICKNCTKHPAIVDDESTLDTLVRLMGQIKDIEIQLNHGFQFARIARDENKAAHRLAKDAKKKRNGCEDAKEIKPVQFPNKLKNILFHDAYGLDTRYSRSLRELLV